MAKSKPADAGPNKQDSFEETLWKTADKLRKNIDAAEYKHIVLGLIFLKYISDAFEDLHTKLTEGKGDYEDADPESPHEYVAEKVFFVPPVARWKSIADNARKNEIMLENGKTVTIGGYVDEAMEAIERQNKSLKGVLPKVFSRPNLDPASLAGLIDLVGSIALGTEQARAKDVLGQVYEYFLGQFALAEGKKGGSFYTPQCVVKLLVAMLEPYQGLVFDPCCGSGGMFVQSEKFVAAHQDHYRLKQNHPLALNPTDNISLYGQESNQTTWRLAMMNLAIRQIDCSNIKWNSEGSFLNDEHKDLKANFIIANPPFNDSDWSGELLQDDARWVYGKPPAGNANYAWIQHFIYHMSPIDGRAGFVLAKGSLTSKTSGEGEIRKNIIEARLLDCIVNLPAKLFLNTQIPACLWFLSRKKVMEGTARNVLFIDARNLGYLINRRTRDFTDEDIARISETYHHWAHQREEYADVPGFCKSVSLAEIREKDYVLTPGRYIGLPEDEDDFDFVERFSKLKLELDEQMAEEIRLNALIRENLEKIEVRQ